MSKVKVVSEKEMKQIIGGKYYGNGLSCSKKGCTVNWGQTFSCGVNRVATAGHGKC